MRDRSLRSLFRRRGSGPDPVPIAELRQRFAAMERDELYRIRRMWVARYLPIWYAVHGTVAEAAGWPEKRRTNHRAAMDQALEVADLWWSGGKRVEARRNEIESAVSAITHFAPMHCPDEPWVPQARLAALQMRYLLAFVYDPTSDFCIHQSAKVVYDWGELETWWPADTATLYGDLATGERVGNDEAMVLVYTVGARRAGLEREGRAVVEAVHDIVGSLGSDPGPFDATGFTSRGAGDALRQRQRAQGYARFHGKEPPRFLR